MDMDMNTDTGTVEGQECQTLGYSFLSVCYRYEKLTIPKPVHKRIKGTQFDSFLVQYQTERMDRWNGAGMPRPALVSRMPMPSHAQV